MAIYTAPSLVITDDGTTNADSGILGIHNVVSMSNVVTDTEDADFPATNLANDATDLEWNATTTATQYITIDVSGYGDLLNYMGIAGHNLGTAGIAFSVEADLGSGFVEIIPSAIAADDAPILLRWDDNVPDTVRLKLWSGGSEVARIATIYVGKLLVLQRRIYVGHTPVTMGYEQDVTSAQSESGNFLGRIIIGASNQTSVSLSNLTASWYRTYLEPFVKLARTRPFFYGWRPQSYPQEVGYCWLKTMPVPVNDLANGMMKVSLSLRGIVS